MSSINTEQKHKYLPTYIEKPLKDLSGCLPSAAVTKMRIKRMHKRMSIALLAFTVTVVAVFHEPIRPRWMRSLGESVSEMVGVNQLYTRADINIENKDVLVVINIPRTGVLPLTDQIVRNANIPRPCHCKWYRTKCQCLNTEGRHWLFNAYNSTGTVCGRYAGYNEIKNSCPIDYWFRTSGKDKREHRRYHLVTMLRDPINRYISEYSEFKSRDWTYVNEPRLWRKTPAELQKKELKCLLGKRIQNLSLEEFVACPNNPANNRMTRMLANTMFVDSLNLTSNIRYKSALLISAKNVLRRTAFFGLYHRPADSQMLIEEVLGAKLNKSLSFISMEDNFNQLAPSTKHQILLANDLDAKLFQFAKELFDARVVEYRSKHPSNKAQDGNDKTTVSQTPVTAVTPVSEAVSAGAGATDEGSVTPTELASPAVQMNAAASGSESTAATGDASQVSSVSTNGGIGLSGQPVVASMGDDVDEFFKKLAAAKGAGLTDTQGLPVLHDEKESDMATLGEKFRQLQGHPGKNFMLQRLLHRQNINDSTVFSAGTLQNPTHILSEGEVPKSYVNQALVDQQGQNTSPTELQKMLGLAGQDKVNPLLGEQRNIGLAGQDKVNPLLGEQQNIGLAGQDQINPFLGEQQNLGLSGISSTSLNPSGLTTETNLTAKDLIKMHLESIHSEEITLDANGQGHDNSSLDSEFNLSSFGDGSDLSMGFTGAAGNKQDVGALETRPDYLSQFPSEGFKSHDDSLSGISKGDEINGYQYEQDMLNNVPPNGPDSNSNSPNGDFIEFGSEDNMGFNSPVNTQSNVDAMAGGVSNFKIHDGISQLQGGGSLTNNAFGKGDLSFGEIQNTESSFKPSISYTDEFSEDFGAQGNSLDSKFELSQKDGPGQNPFNFGDTAVESGVKSLSLNNGANPSIEGNGANDMNFENKPDSDSFAFGDDSHFISNDPIVNKDINMAGQTGNSFAFKEFQGGLNIVGNQNSLPELKFSDENAEFGNKVGLSNFDSSLPQTESISNGFNGQQVGLNPAVEVSPLTGSGKPTQSGGNTLWANNMPSGSINQAGLAQTPGQVPQYAFTNGVVVKDSGQDGQSTGLL